MENIKQGFDPRQNCEKPETTWQKFETEKNILTVHLTDDPNSPIYYQGAPIGYYNGAVRNNSKPDYFIGDDNINGVYSADVVAEAPQEPASEVITEEATNITETPESSAEATTEPETATEEAPIDPVLE